jgi:hypothetical protein
MRVSLDAQQSEESRLKPTFCLDLLEASIEPSLLGGLMLMLVRAGRFAVDEIAPFSVHAGSLSEEDAAFLGLIPAVGLLILLEFVRAVRELALLFIGAEAEFNKLLAELRFFLILPYGRFAVAELDVTAWRCRVLS